MGIYRRMAWKPATTYTNAGVIYFYIMALAMSRVRPTEKHGHNIHLLLDSRI